MTSPAPDLATNLRVATLRLSRRLRRELVSSCTESQYAVLAALVHVGPLSPGELAERERVQAPSMTRTVAALEEAGLVARTKHPTDGRGVVVTITDAGREVVAETKRRRNAWLNQALAGLSKDERDTVGRAAEILRRMTEG
ncbi:MarR family winged helix-turn-helix transcriptional regulator [Georgenia muralis]